MKRICLLGAALFFLGVPDVNADTLELLNACKLWIKAKDKSVSATERLEVNYCYGYVSGFYDGRTTSDYGKSELMSCFPPGLSWEQLIRIFVKWANDNPQKLHYDTWQGLREAFSKAFPCKEK